MKRIAVLDYSTGNVDIITLPDQFTTHPSFDVNDAIEEYLIEECGYNLSQIYWMECKAIRFI